MPRPEASQGELMWKIIRKDFFGKQGGILKKIMETVGEDSKMELDNAVYAYCEARGFKHLQMNYGPTIYDISCVIMVADSHYWPVEASIPYDNQGQPWTSEGKEDALYDAFIVAFDKTLDDYKKWKEEKSQKE